MTPVALRASTIGLGAAALVLTLPLSTANAAPVAHHYHHVAPAHAGHVHGYVARGRAGHHNYVSRNGRRYAYGYGYGYNPGAAAAAGVIGGVLGGLAAGYPRSARIVVRFLGRSHGLPWHRVVAAGGRIATPGEHALDQRFRLEMEGVKFSGRKVRMKEFEFKFPSLRKGGKKKSGKSRPR